MLAQWHDSQPCLPVRIGLSLGPERPPNGGRRKPLILISVSWGRRNYNRSLVNGGTWPCRLADAFMSKKAQWAVNVKCREVEGCPARHR